MKPGVIIAIVVIAAVVVGFGIYMLSAARSEETTPMKNSAPTDTQQPGTRTSEEQPPSGPVPPAPPTAANPQAALKDADTLIAAEKWTEARALLSGLILNNPDPSDFRAALKERLDRVNQRIFFSRESSVEAVKYKVVSGDTLSRVSRQFKVSPDLIMLVNNKKRDMIVVGELLKIPQGKFSVIVERQYFRLIVLFNGAYLKEYSVGLGKDGKTPVGAFIIGKMVKNPQWTSPEGRTYGADSPENPLGTRWIGFEESAEHAGLGIHGTIAPNSIGKLESNGCVRMLNSDIEEVYTMLSPRDAVVIK